MKPPVHADFTGGRRCPPNMNRKSPAVEEGIAINPTGDSDPKVVDRRDCRPHDRSRSRIEVHVLPMPRDAVRDETR
jgi:hypothetical protein